MEIIRKSPTKIYAKSNTGSAVKFLAFVAVVLVILVFGLCVFVAFGRVEVENYHLDNSKDFYYSINGKQARLEKYIGNHETYSIPGYVNYQGTTYPVTEISAQAFTNQKQITSLKIPDTVEAILGESGDVVTGAFSGCINLATIQWGSGLTRIGNYAFKNCLKLSTLTIPESVQFVDEGAFMNCLGLTQIKIMGNGQLDPTCFAYAVNVATLELGDNVQLGESQRQALARLINLTNFTLQETNEIYLVQDHCLLGDQATNLVIGGIGMTDFPATVTKIDSWAFGDRYGNLAIELPARVTTLGDHAFTSGVVYTAAATIPEDWHISLPVRCSAQLVNFYRNYQANDSLPPVAVYVYQGEDGLVMPKYTKLFGEPDAIHTFVRWGEIEDGNCLAIYDNGEIAADKSDLDTVVSMAATYFDNHTVDENLRLKFTLNFWENFKMVYYYAVGVFQNPAARVYEVNQSIVMLQNYLDRIADPTSVDPEDLTGSDWRVELQALIDLVAFFQDYESDFVQDTAWEDAYYAVELAQITLSNDAISDSTGKLMLKKMRADCEALTADLTNLMAEIERCSALIKNKNQYVTETWENLETALSTARQITEHNLMVVNARLNLTAARQALQLIPQNAASQEELIELYVWLDVCFDLDESQYNVTNFNVFKQKVDGVFEQLDEITTQAAVKKTLNDLKTAYNRLVPIEQPPVRHTTSTLRTNMVWYFVVAAILFTVAMIVYAVAGCIKQKLRSKNHE